eukprot:gnl/MRDRNA2_/MRDRNA2_103801_c0_seq1.p1 gnl/MRDRNA2_/MRDRNA2_103801_c0~~gnl/MRDRNA2_/MRDRNA2_103801_c0_seq1.p1  ORF type:complete len:313 (-),score=76.91 gnl/MRDRNA2_/MRDRNA2_103801_c0_seq1:82-1020(-)
MASPPLQKVAERLSLSIGLASECVPVPISFRCPITHELMMRPVATYDGYVYERSAILQWFQRGNRRSPMTGQELPSLALREEVALRQAIEEYISYRPDLIRKELDFISLETAAAAMESELASKAAALDEVATWRARAESAEDALETARIKLRQLEQDNQGNQHMNLSEYVDGMFTQQDEMVARILQLEDGHKEKDQKIRDLEAAVASLDAELSSTAATLDVNAASQTQVEMPDKVVKRSAKKNVQHFQQEKENIAVLESCNKVADCVGKATLQHNPRVGQINSLKRGLASRDPKIKELSYVAILQHRMLDCR